MGCGRLGKVGVCSMRHQRWLLHTAYSAVAIPHISHHPPHPTQAWRTRLPPCWALPTTMGWRTCGPWPWTGLCTTTRQWHALVRYAVVDLYNKSGAPGRLCCLAVSYVGTAHALQKYVLAPVHLSQLPPSATSSEAYHNLSREQVALVAEEACRLHAAMIRWAAMP